MKKEIKFIFVFAFFFSFLFPNAIIFVHPVDSQARRECPDLVEGNPRKDGIPPIDDPRYISASEYENTGYFNSKTRVIGIEINGIAKAYPMDILTHHEIVNDVIDGVPISLTYCPLTGSGLPFLTADLNGSSLGTTGFLYENNLIFYDRLTDTYWSQMYTQVWCSVVDYHLTYLPTIPVYDTKWETWKTLHPDTEVLSRETGYIRNYDANPYGPYDVDPYILFPTQWSLFNDPYRLYDPKELTLVLANFQTSEIGGALFAYSELENSPVINYNFRGEHLLIIYDEKNSMATTFSSLLANGSVLEFMKNERTNVSKSLNLMTFKDKTGSIWNLKGEAIDGPLKGQTLKPRFSYTAYWFAASSFYPSSEIFSSPKSNETKGAISTDTKSLPKDVSTQSPNLDIELGGILIGLTVVLISYSKLQKRR